MCLPPTIADAEDPAVNVTLIVSALIELTF